MLLKKRFIAALTLPFNIYMIFDFLDISAIEDGFLMIFKNACIISLIRDKSKVQVYVLRIISDPLAWSL